MASAYVPAIFVQLPADKRPRGQVLSSTVLQALCEAQAALGERNYRAWVIRDTYVRRLLERRSRENVERERKRLRRESRWTAITEGRQAPMVASDFHTHDRWGSEDAKALAAVRRAETNGHERTMESERE